VLGTQNAESSLTSWTVSGRWSNPRGQRYTIRRRGLGLGTASFGDRRRGRSVCGKPDTHRRRDATVELSRVGGVRNSQLVGDSCDESEQICQQRVELRRDGGGNASVGSRELVANCVHTADVTQLDSCVASASATVSFGDRRHRRCRCVRGRRIPPGTFATL